MTLLAGVMRAADRHRLLERATLVYISLPFLIFAGGWLKPIFAIPVLVVTLVGLYRAQQPERSPSGDGRDAAPPTSTEIAAYVTAFAAVAFVVLFSGNGAYAEQVGGQFRNTSFIRDLIQHPWPLGFQDVGPEHEPGVLAFYIANSLVPALCGLIFGWKAAFHFQFVWTLAGVLLAVCWFMRVIGRRAPQYVLMFLLFGGLDVIARGLAVGWEGALNQNLDIWTFVYQRGRPAMGGVFWVLPSNVTILFDSPHHALCSWLSLLVVVDDAANRGTCRRAGLVSSFALLWSAFSFVGLAPFVLCAVVASRWRGMLSFENLVTGVTVLAVTGLYIGSNNAAYIHGPIWQFLDVLDAGWLLALVCLLEFGVYVILLTGIERRRDRLAHPMWLWTAAGVLILTPWYRLGRFCDFTSKASIPALVVLQLCLAYALANVTRSRRLVAGALVTALAIGSASAVMTIYHGVFTGLDFSPPRLESVMTTNEIRRSTGGAQLFSDGKGLFWEVLARPVDYQPNSDLPIRPDSKRSKRRRR